MAMNKIGWVHPVFNPKYLDFANHYGFAIRACAVGKGNEKGRVENGVGYVKKTFWLASILLTLSWSTRRP
jgi:transposase